MPWIRLAVSALPSSFGKQHQQEQTEASGPTLGADKVHVLLPRSPRVSSRIAGDVPIPIAQACKRANPRRFVDQQTWSGRLSAHRDVKHRHRQQISARVYSPRLAPKIAVVRMRPIVSAGVRNGTDTLGENFCGAAVLPTTRRKRRTRGSGSNGTGFASPTAIDRPSSIRSRGMQQ